MEASYLEEMICTGPRSCSRAGWDLDRVVGGGRKIHEHPFFQEVVFLSVLLLF